MHDIHSVPDPTGFGGSSGVFGFGMLWNGHTDDPVAGWQPKAGWNPSELLLYYDGPERFQFYSKDGTYPFDLEEGLTYNFILRVEQTNIFDYTYSMKVWEETAVEPVDWLLERTISYAEPMTGSLMLLTHYYDVTFNDLSVTEIEGSDIIQGSEAGDLLSAVDLLDTAPGYRKRI